MLVRFQAVHASDCVTFHCPSCGKDKRKRTFREECTINPFNTNEDGSVKTAQQVRDQARAQVATIKARFLAEPLCLKCEDALSFKDRAALFQRRRALGRE